MTSRQLARQLRLEVAESGELTARGRQLLAAEQRPVHLRLQVLLQDVLVGQELDVLADVLTHQLVGVLREHPLGEHDELRSVAHLPQSLTVQIASLIPASYSYLKSLNVLCTSIRTCTCIIL